MPSETLQKPKAVPSSARVSTFATAKKKKDIIGDPEILYTQIQQFVSY